MNSRIKKIINKLRSKAAVTIILLSSVVFSCTDVVDVAVPTEASRLVIEASLDWEKGHFRK